MTWLAAACALALVACDAKPTNSSATRPAAAPRIEATLQLPHGDGRVHIVAMPTEYLEITRCLVAVGPNGAASVSCTPKDLDIPATDQP